MTTFWTRAWLRPLPTLILATRDGTSMRTRTWLALVGLAVVASTGAVVLIHHQRDRAREAADRGTLTSAQYDRAVAIAHSVIAKDPATVSRAVAYVVAGRVQDPNLSNSCTSGHLLIVSLVGDFPTVAVGGFAGPGAPSGPDKWVTVKADPTSGKECLIGVSLGQFKAAAGAANLTPAL
jgi:hypothetical protein